MKHPAAPSTLGTSHAPERPLRTVLLVDDDPAVLRTTGRVLRGIGLRVLEAEDGLDALARLREHEGRVDLVITDVVMPRMDGNQLAYALAHLQPGLPVLFITAFVGVRLDQIGDTPPRVLEKPFDIGQLVATTLALLADSTADTDDARLRQARA